jgi:hypothetical protein
LSALAGAAPHDLPPAPGGNASNMTVPPVDGVDLWPYLTGAAPQSPVEVFFALALCGRARHADGKAKTRSWSHAARESELSAVAGALDVLIEQDES